MVSPISCLDSSTQLGYNHLCRSRKQHQRSQEGCFFRDAGDAAPRYVALEVGASDSTNTISAERDLIILDPNPNHPIYLGSRIVARVEEAVNTHNRLQSMVDERKCTKSGIICLDVEWLAADHSKTKILEIGIAVGSMEEMTTERPWNSLHLTVEERLDQHIQVVKGKDLN